MGNFQLSWDPPIVTLEIIDPAKLNDLDAKSVKTINATDGSVHAPTSPIIIGGQGLQVTGPFTANDVQTVTVPSGGTLTIDAGATGEINGTILLGAGVGIAVATRTYQRICWPLGSHDVAKWAATGSGGHVYPLQVVQQATVTSATADQMPYAVNAPDAATITSVTVMVQGQLGAHGATLPANMPRLALYKYDALAATETLIASQPDTSATVAAYELLHAITLSGLSNVVVASHEAYVIRVSGEWGADSALGFRVNAPVATFTRAKIGEE